MARPEKYNTKQRDIIYGHVAALGGEHATAAQIYNHFRLTGAQIGRATVYRHLEELVGAGKLRKFLTDGTSGACYQYIESDEGCAEHLHLKCEGCGALQHLECDALGNIARHMADKHAFVVNSLKTVLYGICDGCMHKT